MLEALQSLGRLSIRQFLYQAMNLCLILSSALMIWKGMTVLTASESPIVVVLSGSMEPAFFRGDLLFLTLNSKPMGVGDICVFKIKGRDIPIVHRIMHVHNDAKTGKQKILTKGDNNPVDDRGLYLPGQLWITEDDIVGRVQGLLPYVGMVTIIMNDYPQLKYLLLGCLGLFVLVNKE